MVADPVGHGLYQDRLVLTGGDLPSGLGGVVHSQHVVTVNPDGGHAVGGSSHGDACQTKFNVEKRFTGDNSPSPRYCSLTGVEMAYPLLRLEHIISPRYRPNSYSPEENYWTV